MTAAPPPDLTATGAELRADGLTDRDRAILDLERSWWRYPGAKETAIRERFGTSATLYYRRLNWLIDQPEALAHDPMVVGRLRRVREARREGRRGGRRVDAVNT